MTGTREPVRRVALDTNYYRGASVELIAAIVERGFQVSVSLNAFAEHWLRSHTEDNIGLLVGRAKRLKSLVDPRLPLLPTGAQLVALIGGTALGAPEPRLTEFLTWTREVWSELTAGNVHPGWWTQGALASLATIGEDEEVFDGLRRLTPEMFPAVVALPERQAAARLGAIFRQQATLLEKCPYGVQSRKHAFYAAAALHIVRAHQQPASCSIEPNVAEDIDLLQHLATPALLLTRDFPLISLVDQSGTCQAPWVRTIGELLTDGPPPGLPWGKNAWRVAEGFIRRQRNELSRLDDETAGRLRRPTA